MPAATPSSWLLEECGMEVEVLMQGTVERGTKSSVISRARNITH